MKLGVITDIHLAAPGTTARFHNPYDFAGTQGRFERALALHRANGVDAIALLGDLANAGDEEHHLLAIALSEAAADGPVWVIPGNHDCEEGHDALLQRLTKSGSSRIRIPSSRGEDCAGLRIAGLPPVSFNTEARWFTAKPELGTWGDEPVLLLCHAPVHSRAAAADAAELNYAGDVTNHLEVSAALATRTAPTIVLHGHLHLRDAVITGASLQLGIASVVEPPFETASISIERNGDALDVHVRHIALAESAVERLPVLCDADTRWRFAAGRWSELPVA